MRPDKLQELERIVATAFQRSAETAEAVAEFAWTIWTTDLPRAEELSRGALEIAEEGGHLRARARAGKTR